MVLLCRIGVAAADDSHKDRSPPFGLGHLTRELNKLRGDIGQEEQIEGCPRLFAKGQVPGVETGVLLNSLARAFMRVVDGRDGKWIASHGKVVSIIGTTGTVAGISVGVGGSLVDVGGSLVDVGGISVAVGGSGVSVGGIGVSVSVGMGVRVRVTIGWEVFVAWASGGSVGCCRRVRVGSGRVAVGRAVAVSVSAGSGVREAVRVGTAVGVGTKAVTACSVSAAAVLKLATAISRRFTGPGGVRA